MAVETSLKAKQNNAQNSQAGDRVLDERKYSPSRA